MPSPNGSLTPSGLAGVAAVSARDVWAVGSSGSAGGPQTETLAEHWDGGKWSVVRTPNPGLANELRNVATISTSDVWAVGSYSSRKTGYWPQPLAVHWDGARWSVVATPLVGLDARLASVAAISSNDVWAVGSYRESGANPRTLAMHWDGAKWSVVTSPNVGGTAPSSLSGVAALSRNDVWAVGGSGSQTLTMRWDGARWTVVASPNVDEATNGLSVVTSVATNDVWTVGVSRTQGTTGGSTTFYTFKTLTMHWDGSSWTIAPSPNPAVSLGPTSVFNVLRGAAAVSADDVWSVGYYSNGNAIETLIERYTVP